MAANASPGMSRSLWIENALFCRRMALLLGGGVGVSDALLGGLTLCREPALKKALFDTFTAWTRDPANPLGREWQAPVLSRSVLLLAHAGLVGGSLGKSLGEASEHLFDLLSFPPDTERKWEHYRGQYFFFAQLGRLLAGGASMANAMFAIVRETPNDTFRRIAGQLESVALGGGSIVGVLEANAKHVDAPYVERIALAEQAGDMPDAGLVSCLAALRKELGERLGYAPQTSLSRAGQPPTPERVHKAAVAKARVFQSLRAEADAHGSILPVEAFRGIAGEFQVLGVRDIAERVQAIGLEGRSWLEALREHPEAFPRWELALLAHGEETAELGAACGVLAELAKLDF